MPPTAPDDHAIAVHLDKLLADRGMTLTELSERVGVGLVNLSILKNGHARAIRFSTLTRLCQATCSAITARAARPNPNRTDSSRRGQLATVEYASPPGPRAYERSMLR